MEEYDIVVIGAGPGGYVGAIRAAQLGFKTACIEKNATLGGTCLNIGCIPSKALLHASEQYHDAQKNFTSMGIDANVSLNLPTMMAHKLKIVDDLTKGIGFLFKKNNIAHIQGHGTILDDNIISINNDGEEHTIRAKHIVIATGSVPTSLPNITIDEHDIVSSTGALSFDNVPEHLCVVGAGVIGLELGSVWARLGAKVTVVEFLDRVAPSLDSDIAKDFKRILTKQGMAFKMGQKVTSIDTIKKGLNVNIEDKKGKVDAIQCDKVLICVGRKPYTENLGLEALNITQNSHGFIEVDHNYQTSKPGIYAIGDTITGPMLAHKAEEEAVCLMELLAGQKPHIDYNTIPGVIYTTPEVADVGMTEDYAKEHNIEYKIGKFPFSANSRARANGTLDGMVKLVVCAKSDALLGAHIIGPQAGNMIHEAVLVMEYGGSAEDIARSCHAHPTFNEAFKEAALAVNAGAIHM